MSTPHAPWYVPPQHAIVEVRLADERATPAVRWFAGFDGEPGKPAEQVSLGFSAKGKTMLCASYRHRGDAAMVRTDCAVLAIRSEALAGDNRYDPTTFSESLRWTPATWIFDEQSLSGFTAATHPFTFAVVQSPHVDIALAARDTDLNGIIFSTLIGGEYYDLDPLRPHDLDELERAMRNTS